MQLVCLEDTVSPKNTENALPFNNTSNTPLHAIPGFDPLSVIAGTPSSSTIAPSAPSSAVAPAAPSSTIAPAAQSAAIAPAAPSCAIAPATPSCAIAPVAPPATIPAESTKTSDKFRLSSEEMAKYAKLPTQKFCTLQAIHIRYWIHLGQGRMQRENVWNNYLANSEEVHQSFQSSAKLQLSEQNQLAAEGYRQAQSSAAGVALPGTQSNNLAEVFTRRKTLPSQKKMMEGVEAWKLTVQRQLKEMSNSMQIEGFLVLALQDCTHNFFLQGGSFLGQQYL
ncbi:hypothetical protein PCANC_04395 [Puccinia coronata f. sp. avenae]|uniref:Uncharacterized protein n=1 Tax=Puccinia coronata f. sp. avenae TaxID=200324 RepID=A0A2N5T953_9BASI|nr:hypothetical protein PCANC_04395 [Puccinia coronata f. sp. avenae]PLW48783.1 hypothetical protein PCASD_03179 [Puccinia coronata f. sp. avenae]